MFKRILGLGVAVVIATTVVAWEEDVITDLGQPVAGAIRISALTSLDNKIYGGTWQDGKSHMFVYDPATQSSIDLGIVDSCKIYGLVTGKDNLIYSIAKYQPAGQPAQDVLLIYDPSQDWNPGINPYIRGYVSPEITGDFLTITSAPDGKIYGGTGDMSTAGKAYLFCYDPQADTIISLGKPDFFARVITDLTAGKDGKIYGGLYGSWSGDFFVYDPVAGATTVLGEVFANHNVGAITTNEDGRIYGFVDGADPHLFNYDPTKSWNPGSDPTNNPYIIGSFPTGTGVITTGKNERIYSSDGGGTFFSYDPRLSWNPGTADINNYRQYETGIPGATDNRSLTTGDDGFIYGGTNNGHLFVFVPGCMPCREMLSRFDVRILSGTKRAEIINEVLNDSQVILLKDYAITNGFGEVPTYNFASYVIYTPTNDSFTVVFLQYAREDTSEIAKEIDGGLIVYIRRPRCGTQSEAMLWIYRYSFGKPVLIEEFTVVNNEIIEIFDKWKHFKRCWGELDFWVDAVATVATVAAAGAGTAVFVTKGAVCGVLSAFGDFVDYGK